MNRRIVLIHTVPALIECFAWLGREILPGVEMLHVLDEPLLERVRRQGGISEDDVERLQSHVAEAVTVGAEVVLVTCSTLSRAVDRIRGQSAVPLVKIDEAMAAEAVQMGPRIGVIATNRTTLEPTRALLLHAAQAADRRVSIEMTFVPGALAALMAGNGDLHDQQVAAAISEAAGRADVVVLAQATMARVLEKAAVEGVTVPLLASPRLALEQVRTELRRLSERAAEAWWHSEGLSNGR